MRGISRGTSGTVGDKSAIGTQNPPQLRLRARSPLLGARRLRLGQACDECLHCAEHIRFVGLKYTVVGMSDPNHGSLRVRRLKASACAPVSLRSAASAASRAAPAGIPRSCGTAKMANTGHRTPLKRMAPSETAVTLLLSREVACRLRASVCSRLSFGAFCIRWSSV